MIVSAAAVQLRLLRALTGDEVAAVEAMSRDFQAELESILGRPLEPTSVTETRFVPRGMEDLALSQTPVVSIEEVRVGATVVDPSAYQRAQNGLLFTAAVFPFDLLAAQVYPETEVTITYTAGLDASRAAPARSVIVSRCVRVMSRAQDDAHGLSQVKVEDYQAWYESEPFSEAELRTVSRLKRRVCA